MTRSHEALKIMSYGLGFYVILSLKIAGAANGLI